ncbi:hypothetical protein N866_15885 [Actinotalea ferrariae CF5-4]|uniref:Lipoprotein n=1 Tax=Actinotalea ferrariae CF5-4 TaxID=948458 RepID=A0A021VVK7_9CELL|nr:hypothetical protein [Actinotalea ferrariae]EYR64080.1 hypothetical protein N866_15885 [Actinotalea ferrariae CF5-4]
MPGLDRRAATAIALAVMLSACAPEAPDPVASGATPPGTSATPTPDVSPTTTPGSTPAPEPTAPEASGPFSLAPADADVTAADLALVERLITFSLDPDDDAVPALGLAPEGVRLGLADRLLAALPVASAADPAAWRIPEEEFRAHSGPFSALDVLRHRTTGAEGSPAVPDGLPLVVTVGEHPHCAAPPVAPPAEVAALRRVAVQPAEAAMSSCLDWFTVDLFVDDGGVVRAVTLDLWEP